MRAWSGRIIAGELHSTASRVPVARAWLIRSDAVRGRRAGTSTSGRLAQQAPVVEAPRKSVYAPLKNADGTESADWARERISTLHCRWLADAGIEAEPGRTVEISPLCANFAEDLAGCRPIATGGYLRSSLGKKNGPIPSPPTIHSELAAWRELPQGWPARPPLPGAVSCGI